MAYDETLRSVSLDGDASLAVYTGVPGQPGSAVPNGGKQYHFVKVTGSHTVGLADATSEPVIGVVQNKVQQAGQAATVAYLGISRVVADKALDAGDVCYCSADGQATDAAGGGPAVGIVIEGTAAAGEIAAVLLTNVNVDNT